MSIYLYHRSEAELDRFALFLRRQGYAAYVEADGDRQYLITNYRPTGYGFTYCGRR